MAERRYREIFENAPAMYVVTRARDASLVVDECNRCFYDVLGYEPAEVIGQPLTDFLVPDRDGASHGGLPAVLTAKDAAIEQALLARDGRILHVLAISHPDHDERQDTRGYLTIFVDNEARNAVDVVLRESLEQAHSLARGSLDSVIVTDGEGAITEFNPASEQMLGHDRATALGRTLPALLYASIEIGERNDDDIWKQISQGRPLDERFETTVLRKDGQRIPVELTVTRVDGSHGAHYVCYLRDISSRVAIETALRASEERFRGLVQNSYDVITVVSRDGARAYVSPSIERLLGYSPDSLHGLNALSLVHPDDAESLRTALDACLNGASQSSRLEVRFRRKDGSWRTFETIGTNLLDEPGINGVVFNSRDITSRKAAEAALRSSEERFRAAFDNAPIGLAIVTPDGQFREVNRALCELVGYAEAELLDMAPADITDIEDVDDELELFARLWAGEMEHFQLNERYVHKGGHSIWVELTVSAVEERPGTRYAITQIQDVSTRHRLEMERATMLASERAYARQVRELAAIRVDLTRIVSHELRAPVAALQMMVTALATGELSARDQQETYQAVQSQIDQLDRLVDDVAAVATAEREDFSVQFHDVPLPVLLAGARAFVASAMDGHPVSIPDGGQIRVWCDPDRISQVLRNLLENVARHTPAGTPAAIRVHQRGDLVRIEVSDQGAGVPDEDQSIIFEKFARGRVAIDSQQPGAGLGLYLSRQIVNAHGAELSYTAGADGGASFGFDLRMAP
jgi:PAS domain S-box-containing protein